MIKVSAPGKIHLLGEHAVVYGKPALLTTVDLRVNVILSAAKDLSRMRDTSNKLKKVIEPIVKKYLKIQTIPPYQLNISSQIPIGSGLGSSAAVSASYIAALLSFLKVQWDLNLINDLTFEAEKVFHGNPSGGDNFTVCFGGLVWFRKSDQDRQIKPLNINISPKLSKNFCLINTGTPKESTKKMVENVKELSKKKPKLFKAFLQNQERLTKKMLSAIKKGNEDDLIRIIRTGEKNLESIGVVSPYAASIIKKIEKVGGAAKICGGGGKTKATGVLLAYHQDKKKLTEVAMSYNLPCYTITLGTEGLKQES